MEDFKNIERCIPKNAKAGCIGEFNVTVSHVCPECWHNGWSQDCEICGGKSDEETNCYDVKHDIPWTTQKDIWKAINSYDQHVELIAKQAEQIKMLREALELVRPEIYYNQDGVEVWAGGNMYIGTDDDADNKTMQKIHEVLSATEQE